MRTNRAVVAIGLALLLATTVRADPAAKPRPHFDFLYSQGLGTRISTYDSTLTKDEVIDPDTTITFVLPQADIDSVYDRMMEIHFFDLQEPHPVWPVGCHGGFLPDTQIRLEATLGDKTKQLEWSTDRFPCILYATEGDWPKLRELERLILRILYRQPAFQALPEPKGAYR